MRFFSETLPEGTLLLNIETAVFQYSSTFFLLHILKDIFNFVVIEKKNNKEGK